MTTTTTTTTTPETKVTGATHKYTMSAMWTSPEFLTRQAAMQQLHRGLKAANVKGATKRVAETFNLSIGWTRSIIKDKAAYVFCTGCGSPKVRKSTPCSRCENDTLLAAGPKY